MYIVPNIFSKKFRHAFCRDIWSSESSVKILSVKVWLLLEFSNFAEEKSIP